MFLSEFDQAHQSQNFSGDFCIVASPITYDIGQLR